MNFAIFSILGMGLLVLVLVFGGIGFVIGHNGSVRTAYIVGIVLAVLIAVPTTMLLVGVSQSEINAAGEPFGYGMGAVLFAIVAGFSILGGHLGAWASGRRNSSSHSSVSGDAR